MRTPLASLAPCVIICSLSKQNRPIKLSHLRGFPWLLCSWFTRSVQEEGYRPLRYVFSPPQSSILPEVVNHSNRCLISCRISLILRLVSDWSNQWNGHRINRIFQSFLWLFRWVFDCLSITFDSIRLLFDYIRFMKILDSPFFSVVVTY